MKIARFVVLLVAIAFAAFATLCVSGCGKSAPPSEEVIAEEEAPAAETPAPEETVEVELEGIPDLENLEEEAPQQAPPAPEPEVKEPEEKLVYGYRIQIFASSTQEGAEKAARRARELFSEPVYVEYVAPLFKVRVGDCTSRGEAEALKKKADSLGYGDAWIVESPVKRKY